MTFNPHTDAERQEMLAAIGLERIEDLFNDLPEDNRFPELQLPRMLTEMEASQRLAQLAARNLAPEPGNTFLGAGSYAHYIPATVGQILARGEFYTAYTPYQPEVAQGTLQVIYEFQTLVADLFGMEVANASMYDGATALAEGAHIAVSASKKRQRIVVSGSVHPSYRSVLRTYVDGTSVTVTELPVPTETLATSVEEIRAELNEDVAAVVIQYPNFFGGIEDVRSIADAAHAVGASLVVSTQPVALGILKAPGELGADVVTAEGQSLGVAQSYGGPYVGLLATRQSHVRQMPGRLAGITKDSEGKRGFVLALQTREQHIRREKATSNICTNQGLMATAATVYMTTLGPEGFREVANRCFQNAHYLAKKIAEVPGYAVRTSHHFFNEFVVSTPAPVAEINRKLAEHGIIGGYDLANVDPALENQMLLCATELNDREHIDRFVALLAS